MCLIRLFECHCTILLIGFVWSCFLMWVYCCWKWVSVSFQLAIDSVCCCRMAIQRRLWPCNPITDTSLRCVCCWICWVIIVLATFNVCVIVVVTRHYLLKWVVICWNNTINQACMHACIEANIHCNGWYHRVVSMSEPGYIRSTQLYLESLWWD